MIYKRMPATEFKVGDKITYHTFFETHTGKVTAIQDDELEVAWDKIEGNMGPSPDSVISKHLVKNITERFEAIDYTQGMFVIIQERTTKMWLFADEQAARTALTLVLNDVKDNESYVLAKVTPLKTFQKKVTYEEQEVAQNAIHM